MSEVQPFGFVCVAAALTLPLHKLAVYLMRLQTAICLTTEVAATQTKTACAVYKNIGGDRSGFGMISCPFVSVSHGGGFINTIR